MNKIIVVVEAGFVQEVFSQSKEVKVDIIDRDLLEDIEVDGDDKEYFDEMEEELKNNKDKYFNIL